MSFILNIILKITIHLMFVFHCFKRQTKKHILKVDHQKNLEFAVSVDKRFKKAITFYN